MTSRSCPPHALGPADGRSPLAALAAAITHPDLAPQAVGAVFCGEQVELHVKALGDAHPVDQLLGFRAPAAWDAFGVTVAGRTVPYPGAVPGGGPLADHRPLLLTFLAGRDGSTAAYLLPDGDEPVLLDEPAGSEAQGAIADLCWRVLGRPTAPPQVTVGQFWATWWLDRIVSAGAADPAWSPSWEQLCLLHPDAGRWPAGADAPAHEPSWHRLRTDPDLAHLVPPAASRDVLDWMDDGMFARWSTGALPDPGDLLDAVAELLPSQLVDRVVQRVGEAGLSVRPRGAADAPARAASG